MGLLAGKTTKEVTKGGKYFTGINPAYFKGIKAIDTNDGPSAVLEFQVVGTDGQKSDRMESIYIFSKDKDTGDLQVNVAVLNDLLKALGVEEANLLAAGATITDEMEEWIAAMGAAETPVGLLMYPQKQSASDEYAYHHTAKSGDYKTYRAINPASEAGTLIDIAEVVGKGKKGDKSSGGATNTADKSLR